VAGYSSWRSGRRSVRCFGREQHGVVSALVSLIGKLLITHAATAVGRPNGHGSGCGSWRRFAGS
jgi:hypothetical protein